MQAKKFAIISLVAVFILGISIGIIVDRTLFTTQVHHQKKHKSYTDGLVEKFTKDLNLTPAQQDSLKSILTRVKIKHKELRMRIVGEFKQIRTEFRETFSNILDEEQKRKFNEFNERYDRKLKERQERRKN